MGSAADRARLGPRDLVRGLGIELGSKEATEGLGGQHSGQICTLSTPQVARQRTLRCGEQYGKRTKDKKRPLGGTETKGPGTRIFKRSKQRRAPGREQAEGQEAMVRGQNVRMSDCRGKATGGVSQMDTEAPWQEWGERGRVRIQNAPQLGATQMRPIPRGACSVALRQWAQGWEAEKGTAEQ